MEIIASDTSNLLLKSIQELEKDAFSNEYKTLLMDGLKGFFQGILNMLTVFDAADLRRMMIYSDVIHTHIQLLLSHYTIPLSQDDYLSKVSIISHNMIQLSELCQTRAKELMTTLYSYLLHRLC